MIDGFRFILKDKSAIEKKVITDRLLDYKSPYSGLTGVAEIYPKTGSWKQLKFSIRNDHAVIEGSLHKFFNEFISGYAQNYDDFGLSRIATALTGMKLAFGDSINKADVTMLEFGFNLRIDENAEDMLKYKFLLYRFGSPNLKDTYKGKGYEKGFRRGDYRWKLYDKGNQFDLPYSVIRIEIKITAKRVLKRFGINTPLDLMCASKLSYLHTFFMNEFSNFMIIDNFGEYLDSESKNIINKITNERHWLEFKKLGVSDGIIERRKSEAISFLKNKNLTKTHNCLKELLDNKFAYLINN